MFQYKIANFAILCSNSIVFGPLLTIQTLEFLLLLLFHHLKIVQGITMIRGPVQSVADESLPIRADINIHSPDLKKMQSNGVT